MLLNKETLSPLVIGAKRGQWRRNPGIESGDKEFSLMKPKVLARDQNRCVKCGVSLEGMHVHHRDDDHSNNKMSNLETRCDLCHAVSHVGLLGKSGAIAYFPVSQENLSHLFRTMAVAIQFGGEAGKTAREMYSTLVERFCQPVIEHFGSHNPGDFGNALLALENDDYSKRSTPLQNVRVFFDPLAISSLGTRARKSGFDQNGPELWGQITDSVLSEREGTGGF